MMFWPIELGTGILSIGTFVMVLRLSFGAGRVVEKLEHMEVRLVHLEQDTGCPAPNCPVRQQAIENR